MEKWIYKITNKINGKIYIGQSVDCKRRWKEHINGHWEEGSGNSAIHLAIQKYGVDNFDFEIIEGPISNYNEREIYWIEYYNSYYNGYNRTMGGEEPPIISGENSGLAIYSNEKVYEIQQKLIENNLSFEQICSIYDISGTYLQELNNGTCRKNENLTYPLRKTNFQHSKEEINLIIQDLMYTTKTVEEIAKDRQVASSLVWKINLGNQHYCPSNIDYPIRERFEKISNILFEQIVKELQDNKLKMVDIGNKYNLSYATMSRINRGLKFHKDYLDYPIRKSSQRVYD